MTFDKLVRRQTTVADSLTAIVSLKPQPYHTAGSAPKWEEDREKKRTATAIL